MKVLVTEKNEVVRNTIIHILLKEGYEIHSAADGKEAFEYLTSEKFDIILINITLPYYSGFELISFIKNKLKDNDCKIVVISSNFTSHNIHRLYKMGIDEMIEKPFAPMEMICRLEKLSQSLTEKRNRELH